ncbi:uncharacterized protein [Apostichopus japonicus]|uniref:uncharacterized protein isoform X2 n=1 Tax=Stichopus japonicus TaxID=307972 RepID=UPI003AB5FF80
MDKRKLYVTLEGSQIKKVKLLKREEFGTTYSSLVNKIQQKFKIDGTIRISAKVEKDGLFIEVEEDDEDFEEIVEEALEFKVTQALFQNSMLNQLDASPEKNHEIDSDDNQDEESSCETSIACSTGTQSTSLDLLSMLDTHPKGEEITREYMKNKTLTPQTRITLVNIVCAALVKIHGYYPSPEEKERAARCIIDRFPNLRDKMGKSGHEHFFCKTGGQSGYIQSRLKNIRRHLPKQNQQRPRLGMSGAQYQLTNMENDKGQSTGDLPTIDNDEAKGLADFCRSTPLESKAAILKAMKEFTGNRVNWIKEKSPTMTQIIKEYPQYIEIPEIISQDFQQMFGEETGANFLMKWGQHAKSILEYMKNSRNVKLVELTKEYEGTAKSDELCALYALLGLVHLLPSFNTRKKGKCSREDHIGFFLDFQNIGTSVEDYIRSQQLQTTTRKQPYILALGSRYNVDQYFIAVDGTPIPVSRSACGITTATDLLFKVHFVFNINFAVQLQDFFIYLQVVLYGIGILPGQKVSNRVKEVKVAVESMEKEDD